MRLPVRANLAGLIALPLLGVSLLPAPALAALPELRVAPLRYDTHLDLGHPKVGFIDASNPTGSTIHVTFQVQGFRQINDRGELEFYNDDHLAAAITPGVSGFDLGPRQAVRTEFTIDPNKLGGGGAYAVIFLRTTDPNPSPGEVNTSARVGTLLILDVGPGGTRSGRLTGLKLPPFIIGHHPVALTFAYRNTGASDQSLAYAPALTASFGWGAPARKLTGPFVFPGRQRETSAALPAGNQFGLIPISIHDRSGGSPPATAWMFAITGFWVWLLPLAAIIAGAVWWLHRRRLTKLKN